MASLLVTEADGVMATVLRILITLVSTCRCSGQGSHLKCKAMHFYEI